jgi:His/Glu/Gln/Arg/opine family amino acid ABC transporter permease subunit
MALASLKFSWLTRYWPYFWEGLQTTIQLAFFSVILAIFFGVLIGLMRLSKIRTVSMITAGWVNFIRGIPVMLQIYIVYYGLALNIPRWPLAWAFTTRTSLTSWACPARPMAIILPN